MNASIRRKSLATKKVSCEKCNRTSNIPHVRIPICKSLMGSMRKPGFWKSPHGDIGIIFGKSDLPKILKKKVRLQNIITNSIEKETTIIKQRYVIEHPVIQLLEKNMNKIYASKVFLSSKNFAKLKEFNEMAMDPATNKDYSEVSLSNINKRVKINTPTLN